MGLTDTKQDDLVERWARSLGLADAPLFASHEHGADERHDLLLDGGLGSFAVSTKSGGTFDDNLAREWAYSSDVPHHVAIDNEKIVVTRWDEVQPEAFSITSVEEKLPDFYRYLVTDRVQASRGVVDSLVELFRRTRSAVAETGGDDASTVDVFLAVMGQRLREVGRNVTDINPFGSPDLVARLVDQSHELVAQSEMRTHLDLAIRHAGSEIFQEAHFALVQTSSSDLFGWNAPALAERVSRGTSHFTPPALARIVIEKTIASMSDANAREELVIMDPACGSASFLYEAVRTLRRQRFNGKLRLIGRDTSASAVSMARFMLSFAKGDWQPAGGIELDLKVADTLQGDLPEADIVVMNPPFLSWAAMSSDQREAVSQTLGSMSGGRVDLSMAFISKALDRVRTGGALGSVMPSSLLSLQAAQKWRSHLLEQAKLTTLASLGEYGLFRHATVQVAAIVLSKAQDVSRETLTLIAENESNATGDALRALRRNQPASQPGWTLFGTPHAELVDGSTWKPLPPHIREVLHRLSGLGQIAAMEEVFDIRQGIRTGANKTFVLNPDQFARLTPTGKRYFRPAMTGDNLTDGHLSESDWVFYPHGRMTIDSEEDARKSLKRYYEEFLQPSKSILEGRASILRTPSRKWWELAEHRAWTLKQEGEARIVSKYFGSPGSFALDASGRFAIVQGFAWFPKWGSRSSDSEMLDGPEHNLDDTLDLLILQAFTTIFNSDAFHSLARRFSNHVGGGQIDLSPRYVRNIPVPAMHRLILEERFAPVIRRLAALSNSDSHIDPSHRLWQSEAAQLLVELYGPDILEFQ